MTIPFKQLLESHAKNDIPPRLLALDPGETTGLAFFESGDLKDFKQLPTKNMVDAPRLFKDSFDYYKPDIVVFEEYRVYAWKTQTHSWSDLHTSRVIGSLETLCYIASPRIPYTRQSAQQPKQFCTDNKLKHWNFYQPGQKHARDAIRHGCFYLLFNHTKRETKTEHSNFLQGISS